MSGADYKLITERLDAEITDIEGISASRWTPAMAAALAEDHLNYWPDPQSLPNDLPPVAAFESDLLPQALSGWVIDIAYRMQCPADFTAVAAVVALSSLIGARAVVSPKAFDDWQAVPNLWGLVVGNPGVMKSPALLEATKPLQRLEAVEQETWQDKHDQWKIEYELDEMTAETNRTTAKKEAAKNREKARELLTSRETLPEPVARRYTVNDTSVEKLQEILVSNPWGLLVFRDELHGLICSMDRPGQEGSRSFYLTGYDGTSGYKTDRIVRGTNYINRVCLSMLGGIQPGKVQGYIRDAVNGGAGDDGLLQRFGLTVWPDINPKFTYVDKFPDVEAFERAEAVFARLNDLQPTVEGQPQVWRFSPEAQALFEEWLVPFENEIRSDELHPALVSHLAKYRKLIPALALIFALVDTPESDRLIHQRELAKALDWGDYLRTHAERLYSAAMRPDTYGAKQLLTKIKGGHLKEDGKLMESFLPWKVQGKGWAGLGTSEAVRKAADLLTEYGWLVQEESATGPRGGRPSYRYWIHPKLLKDG